MAGNKPLIKKVDKAVEALKDVKKALVSKTSSGQTMWRK